MPAGGLRWPMTLDPDLLLKHSRDFGNTLERRPCGVALPRSVPELVEALRYAAAERLKVTFRGGGQSFHGQSLCAGGMVVNLGALPAGTEEISFGEGWVRVPASLRVFDLLILLRSRGLRLPVYTVSTRATVGGTLAAGGISGRSFTRGMLAEHVQEVELIGADGCIWTCSSQANQEMFSCSVATMGQYGAILAAKISTEPLLPERVKLILNKFPPENLIYLCRRLRSLKDVMSVEGFIDIFGREPTAEVHMSIEAANIEGKRQGRASWQDFVHRFGLTHNSIHELTIDAPMGFSESLGGWDPWMHDLKLRLLNKPSTRYVIPLSFAIPHTMVVPFVSKLVGFVRSHGEFFRAKPYFAAIRTAPRAPFEWARFSQEDGYAFGIDIFFVFRHARTQAAFRMMDDAARLVADHAGRLYPYGYLPRRELRSLLLPRETGPMRAARDRLDPQGMISGFGEET